MIEAKAFRRPVSSLPPGPRGYPVIGVLPQVLKKPLETLINAAYQYGGVVRLGSHRPGRHVILVSQPGPLKHVLQQRYRAYERVPSRLSRLAGNSLVTLNGDSWVERRRIVQPAFHTKYFPYFVSSITDKASSFVEQWRGPAARGESLNMSLEMSKLTRDIIVKILFGLDLSIDGSEALELQRAVEFSMKYVSSLAFVDQAPMWVPTPRNRAFGRALQTINRIVYRIIDERRRTPGDERDLMTLLLEACDQEAGKGLTDQLLRDEVLTMFVAGHETTAYALAWTWYLLSQHPEVERRLHAEVDEALGGRLPTIEDWPRLTYTRSVLMESMRLYPPGWMDQRTLAMDEDDEIDGHVIPKKSLIYYSPYVTHRLPELWENPDAFDPERFTPDRVAKLPHFTYIPFGAGPQHCVGKHLAEMEACLSIAVIAQHYSLRLVPGTRVEPEAVLSLRPRNGLPMTLQPRR